MSTHQVWYKILEWPSFPKAESGRRRSECIAFALLILAANTRRCRIGVDIEVGRSPLPIRVRASSRSLRMLS